MLLTTNEEIRALMPTSKWNDADMLLACVEEEEQNTLVSILGEELMQRFAEDYAALLNEYGGITPDMLPQEAVTDEVKILRTCQKVQLFLALAHNAGLLSVQLNSGGGLNQATAEYYDKADKEAVNRFVKDAYMKAHRNIDELLAMLERDAKKTEPQFAELWKKSRYYYIQESLLISTATEMQRYLNIGGSREKYIELMPDMRYAQRSYIQPRIGHDLMDAFIRRRTEQLEAEKDAPAEWEEAADLLMAAFALYTEYRNPSMRRKESLDEANLSLASAIDYINTHRDAFRPYVETAPFYVEEAEVNITEWKDPACRCNEPPKFDPCNPHNKVSTLFGAGLINH